jgi:hypothetical protein
MSKANRCTGIKSMNAKKSGMSYTAYTDAMKIEKENRKLAKRNGHRVGSTENEIKEMIGKRKTPKIPEKHFDSVKNRSELRAFMRKPKGLPVFIQA